MSYLTQPPPTNVIDSFIREFEKGRHVCGWSWNMFRDWIGSMAGFLMADMEKLKSHADKYTAEGGAFFSQMMHKYIELADQYLFNDVLGILYMQMLEHNKWAGQYFTPMPICYAMAKMIFNRDEFERIVQKNGFVSVCDPAVGSGAMLLAHGAVVMDELGTWGLNNVRYYGQDIDGCCVDMCKIQLRLHGMDSFGRCLRYASAFADPGPEPPKTIKNEQGYFFLF